ncbi:MAG: acyl-CoA thioesterase II [Dehalococcoidia bacterium]|nr:acyl-CoA thioesterase II [Dehalococcoidia bacterium]
MTTDAGLPAVLRFEQLDANRYRFGSIDAEGRDVVFGGQLLAQMLITAGARHAGKTAQTIHAVFARAASIERPLEFVAETAHSGRSFSSELVTVSQDDRLRARGMVLMHAPDPDLIRHAAPAPALRGPAESTPVAAGMVFPGAELRVVGDAEVLRGAAGPPSLAFWMRWPAAPGDPIAHQAALAWALNGYLISTALRPHREVALDQAHVSISTGVISNTVTFHDAVDIAGWHLFAHESPYAGHGRAYGRIQVFTEDGRLVASSVQDSMVRGVPAGQQFEGQGRTAM